MTDLRQHALYCLVSNRLQLGATDKAQRVSLNWIPMPLDKVPKAVLDFTDKVRALPAVMEWLQPVPVQEVEIRERVKEKGDLSVDDGSSIEDEVSSQSKAIETASVIAADTSKQIETVNLDGSSSANGADGIESMAMRQQLIGIEIAEKERVDSEQREQEDDAIPNVTGSASNGDSQSIDRAEEKRSRSIKSLSGIRRGGEASTKARCG